MSSKTLAAFENEIMARGFVVWKQMRRIDKEK